MSGDLRSPESLYGNLDALNERLTRLERANVDFAVGALLTPGAPLFIQTATPTYSSGPYLWLKDMGGGVYIPMIGP